jgi:cytochrome c-type biogenesis protein CcsB
MSSRVYLLLALGFYAVGAIHALAGVLTRRRLASSFPVVAALAGLALHTAALSQRWTEAGHFPAVGLHDISSFLAWAIVLAFLMTHLRSRVDALGLAVYPAVFSLVLVSTLTPASENESAILKGLFLPIHATFAVLGYGALFVAFAMGVLYLVQERELKARSTRTFYYLLPSLEQCDTVAGRSVAVGLGFLTLAMVTGVLWSHAVRGRYWSWDPKEWSALVAWALYAVVLGARSRSGWGGHKAALLGIAGFAAVAFIFIWINLLAVSAGAEGVHP